MITQVLKITLIFMLTFFGGRVFARPVLAFGDLRGHLEPCGCDPRTDVGGLKRVAAAVERYRRQTPDLLLLTTGNIIPVKEKDPSEAAGIYKAVETIKPTASLINEMEWARLVAKKKIAQLSWVLSNARKKNLNPGVQSVVTVNGLEIYGYLGIKSPELQIVDRNLIEGWKRDTKVKSQKDRVLIFSGTDSDLIKLSKANFFDLIISSNPNPIGVEVGDGEQKNELSLVRPKSGSVITWSVPYGGGGLLRLGGLEQMSAPRTLEASLKSDLSLKPKATELGKTFPTVEMIHWLRQGEESGVSPEIESIFEDVRQASRNQFKLLVEARSKDIEFSEFAGAEACAACHQSSYEVWMKSKHAGAMITLVKKSRHEDPPCIECHVVGFTAKGGYVSEAKTPKLSNVQCENCHGPRKQHILNPLNRPNVDAKASCAECHTPPHSPGFDMVPYWKQIEHK